MAVNYREKESAYLKNEVISILVVWKTMHDNCITAHENVEMNESSALI